MVINRHIHITKIHVGVHTKNGIMILILYIEKKTQIDIPPKANTYRYIRIHAGIIINTHTSINANINLNMNINIYMYKYIYTSIHTHL